MDATIPQKSTKASFLPNFQTRNSRLIHFAAIRHLIKKKYLKEQKQLELRIQFVNTFKQIYDCNNLCFLGNNKNHVVRKVQLS